MSGSLSNMVGMGSNGMGLGGGLGNIPSGDGGLMQMLMAAHQQQQGGQGNPLAPGGQTPMAGLMQSAMQHPSVMPPQMPQGGMAQPQQPQNLMQSMGGPQGILAMIQAMKAGQSGVSGPQQAGGPQGTPPVNAMAPNTGGAGSMIPAWLQAMMGSGSYGATGAGMTPAVGPGGMMGGGV